MLESLGRCLRAPPPPTAAPASSKVAHCAEVVRAATVLLQLLTTVNDWFAARRQQHLVPPMKLTVDVVSDLPVLIVNAPPPLPGQQPTFSKGLLFLDLVFVSGVGEVAFAGWGFFCRHLSSAAGHEARTDARRGANSPACRWSVRDAGRRYCHAAAAAKMQHRHDVWRSMAAVQAAAAAQSRYLYPRRARQSAADDAECSPLHRLRSCGVS